MFYFNIHIYADKEGAVYFFVKLLVKMSTFEIFEIMVLQMFVDFFNLKSNHTFSWHFKRKYSHSTET